MKYFVTSDIHGFYNEFIKALAEKGFSLSNPKHKIVICGDILDRGSQPKEILNFILKYKEKIILIRGNHEDLMEEMVARGEPLAHDLHNGTAYTIIELCPDFQIKEYNLKKIYEQTNLSKVFALCKNYYETKNYIFVHGWIPVSGNMKYDPNWRNANKERWNRARWQNPVEMFRNGVYEPNKTIVCGHFTCSALWHEAEPTKYAEYGKGECFEPFVTKKMIALDACTVRSHKVNVMVVEDKELKSTINQEMQN